MFTVKDRGFWIKFIMTVCCKKYYICKSIIYDVISLFMILLSISGIYLSLKPRVKKSSEINIVNKKLLYRWCTDYTPFVHLIFNHDGKFRSFGSEVKRLFAKTSK